MVTSSLYANPELVIKEHNEQAIRIYDQLKNKYTQKTDPLIIAWGDKLTFYHRGKIQEYPIVTVNYQQLKGMAHVILAVFALFDSLNEFPKNIDEVKTYRNQIIKVEKTVRELPLSILQKDRQEKILTLTNELLDKAIKEHSISQKTINRFFSAISPLIMQNIDEATKIELSLLNQQMAKIQHQLSTEELNQLFVVIPVPKMPRQDNIVGQYFSKYLDVPVESKRLIYAEGLTDTQKILSLVGTWQIESLLSASFFHDPDRMKKDLVSTNAKEYLQHCEVDLSHKRALVCS